MSIEKALESKSLARYRMIDQFLDVLRPRSATVMLETVLESLLYWEEPRQGVPSGFPNRRRAERSYASNLSAISWGTRKQMSTRVDSTPAWQAGALHQVLRSLQAKLIGIQELGSTRCFVTVVFYSMSKTI